MKKTILFILSFFIITVSVSQPQLLSTEMLPFGAAMHQKAILNFSVIDTNIQGNSVTWNFSGLQNNSSIPDLTVTIANPSLTPYGSNFPTANYAYIESPSTAYRYFNLTSAKMERVGSYYTNINTYNDPQIEYVFPLQPGAVSNDTWDNTNSSGGGEYNLLCIGYGTLILPTGTFNNALMVRVWISENGLYEFPCYFWYSSDNGAILLQYIVGDGLWVGEQGWYNNNITMGINSPSLLSSLSYNNPVNDELNLKFIPQSSDEIIYDVVNMMGQKIKSGNFNASANEPNMIKVNFRDLSTGIYQLNISAKSDADKMKSIRLIKL
jgi:hypothetical protein